MKPFLILQVRPTDKASDNELQSILNFGNVQEGEYLRVRMEQNGIPENINLDDYSGVIMGGGPSNISNLITEKTPAQIKFEKQLKPLLDKITEKDFPYLGICYGLGYLVNHQGYTVSKEKYSEAITAPIITITEEGKKDPLLKGLPEQFQAFVGHKEACQNIPPNATLLATGEICPYHMIRIKNNIYATQFHPELDVEGIILRINIYKNAGYFPAKNAQSIIDECRQQSVSTPNEILKRFVQKYKKN